MRQRYSTSKSKVIPDRSEAKTDLCHSAECVLRPLADIPSPSYFSCGRGQRQSRLLLLLPSTQHEWSDSDNFATDGARCRTANV
jgi:hypothetical protein